MGVRLLFRCTLVKVLLELVLACIHEQLKFKPVRGALNYTDDRRNALMTPIRIHFDMRNIQQSTLPQATQDYITVLISYAKDRLQAILSVQSVVGNLYVPRNCSATWIEGPNAGTCSIASAVNQCGEVQSIPREHLGSLKIVNQNGKQMLAAGAGIPNADLVVYVTSAKGSCDTTTLAYANPCHLDQMDRPIVGSINFCPGVIQPSADPAQVANDKAVALHEMIHVVGFSMTLFSYFRDSAGNPRTPRCPDAAGCTEADQPGDPPYDTSTDSYVLSDATVAVADRAGAPARFLATPAVRRVARSYFACPTVPCAELENSGNSEATAGSHWEKRAFFTELMTGSTSTAFPEVLSEFTLALLDDSGWYKVRPRRPAPRRGAPGPPPAGARARCAVCAGRGPGAGRRRDPLRTCCVCVCVNVCVCVCVRALVRSCMRV